MSDAIARLYEAAKAARGLDPSTSRTAKLFAEGRQKMAKKVAEEAVEVSLDAIRCDKGAMVRESADLIYNLVVLWVDAGMKPDDVWDEMLRREDAYGIAEKLAKPTSEKFNAEARSAGK